MATQSQHQVAYRDFIPRDEMACPICQSRCSSIQQLNQHLDDAHSNDQSEEKSAVLSWLRRAHTRITKEMNIKSSSDALQRSLSGIPQIASGVQQQIAQTMQDGSSAFMEQNGEGVTREHWKRERGDGRDVCESAGCRKLLGRLGIGRVHCRKCGKMYCDAHTQHQMRLSLSAQHDPESGTWCRVCEACFVTREGYADLDGVTRNRTRNFVILRKKTMERVHLMENRLEKRMEKLAKVYVVQEKLSSSSQSSLLSFGDKYREQEKSVAKWEDDTSVLRCPFCAQEFKRMTLRKHHCRLCGRVVCAKQSCSSLVPVFPDMSAELYDQEPVGEARACWDCRNSVFRRKEHAEVMARPPPDVKLYAQLMDIRKTIEATLPKFHETVTLLEVNKALPQTHPNYRLAAQTRKDLLELFAKFDALGKKIAAIPTKRADHLRLHQAIHTSASQYLQKNMLPLQMLPKILRPSLPSNGGTDTPSSLNIPDTDPVIREQIAVLQEQHDLVNGYLQEAQKKRKLEDVRSLKANLDALGEEIAQLKA